MKINFQASFKRTDAPHEASPKRLLRRSVLALVVLAGVGIALFLAGRWGGHNLGPPPARIVADQSAKPVGFVKSDDVTQGNWIGNYGAGGAAIAMEKIMLPSYTQVKFPREVGYWVKSVPSDRRALRSSDDPNDRVATHWYSFSSFDIDIQFHDGKVHQVALYMVDWDSKIREQLVRITDVETSKIIDQRDVPAFSEGRYLVWNLSGHVVINLNHIAGANAVVSGLFID